MRKKTLFKMASLFELMTRADLQSDMAKRIMFSILPSLADPSQVAMTQGIVDIKALKTAVEGRHDVIKYGVKSVLNELIHYIESPTKKSAVSVHDTVEALIARNELERAMDIAVAAFQDNHGWVSRYGGRPWELIARSLRQLIRLDKQLNLIRKESPSANNAEKEIQLMRDIVVELNIFDGSAHNSDSILHNLIELETADKITDPRLRGQNKKENYRQIKRLMDAKELNSPIEVFKSIKDTLTDSGDINKFKDWITKIRNQPELFKTDPQRASNLFHIYIRKVILQRRSLLNEYKDDLKNKLNNVESNIESATLKGPGGGDFEPLVSFLSMIKSEMQIMCLEFEEDIEGFIKQYPEFRNPTSATNEPIPLPEVKLAIDKIIAKQIRGCINTYNQLKDLIRPLALIEDLKDDNMSNKTRILGIIKEAMSLINKFSYILDSI